MDNGKKVGLLIILVATVYFLWVLVVAFHEAGFILSDTDLALSLWEWAIVGIALYLLLILFLFFFFFPRTRRKEEIGEFRLVEGKKNQVLCSSCKTHFSVPSNAKRPLEMSCPNCNRKGVLTGKTVTAHRKKMTCTSCGNTFEILDDGTEPLEFECPECHTRDSM